MQPMPFTPRSLPRLTVALVAALACASVTPGALAETGTPLPQGYTGDVTAAPQSSLAPVPQAAPQAPQAAPPPVNVPQEADPEQQAGGDASDQYADTDPSALTDFREPLAPYGQWTQDPTYGTIWVPDSAQVGADFAPYQTAGHWGTADTGDWMWQSDYSWGYIPFHYGRWVWAGSYWGWIPGRRYAPAWVTWRVGEAGYLGWAPLPPTWYWGGGRAVGLWTVPYAAYCFVPTNYAFYNNVSAYVVRDRGMVQAVAAGTHPYRAATPTIGHGRPASPSLSDAHIPASASPRSHAAHDSRSLAFATRSSTAAVSRAYGSQAGHASAAQRTDAWHSSYQRSGRTQAPALRTPSQGQGYPGGYHAAPSYSAPSYHSAPSYSAPSYHAAPSYSAPSYHSAPSYYPGGHYGAPGGSFHPPAVTHSAPAASHFSAPHFSGGRVGGGGRRR